MSKLALELNIVPEAGGKPILQARIPMESLSIMKVQHGEQAVKDAVWQVFNRLAEDLKKPATNP